MTITGVNGAWYKVSYNGTTGYVHSDYVLSLIHILFLCFQRPTGIVQPAGRPAIRSGSSGIPYKRCGFK